METNSEQIIPQPQQIEPGGPIPPVFSYKVANLRYGRLNYINAYMIIMGVFIIPMMAGYGIGMYGMYDYEMTIAVVGWVIYGIFAIISSYFYIRVTVLRLHDLNLSGLLLIPAIAIPVILAIISVLCSISRNEAMMMVSALLMLLLSLLVMAAWILLLAVPGTKGLNKYGEQPRKGSIAGLIVMLVLFVLYIIAIIVVMMFFMMGAMGGYYY